MHFERFYGSVIYLLTSVDEINFLACIDIADKISGGLVTSKDFQSLFVTLFRKTLFSPQIYIEAKYYISWFESKYIYFMIT